MKENKEKEYKPAGLIATHVIIYIILILVYAFLWYKFVTICQLVSNQYKTIEKGEIVEAELVEVEWAGGNNSSNIRNYYNVIYEYIDGDIKYRGVGLYSLDYWDAEKSLGDKIEIYIDGKGLSIPVGHSTDLLIAVLMSIPIAILFPFVFFYKWTVKRFLNFLLKYESKYK